MKKKFLLLTKPSVGVWQIPYLWATAKTYYEENGSHQDQWEWLDPVMVVDDWEQHLENAIELEPELVGFSLYTWNEGTFNLMAKKIREALPNSTIIFGGPQCDVKFNSEYFRQKPYVDMVVPGDAYGEIILKSVLDSIVEHKGVLDASTVPYCYYPDSDRNVIHQNESIDKRNFQWFSNPFRAQQYYFDKYVYDTDVSTNGWAMLETSRGCPYRCSFCDWGGGTYTKTVKKPFSNVNDEIKWISEHKFHGIYLTDANFGLFDIDIEYTKHIVRMAEEYGYPKMVTIQPTKTKIKNLETIFEILAGASLLPQFKIAVEDLNDHVLKNIDRVDFPFEEKMKMIDRLREKFDLPVFVEGILGLPGSSLETIKLDIERTIGRGVEYPLNHPWVLLPETPAYSPEYRKKWGIQTITHKNFGGVSFPLKLKEGFEEQEGVMTLRKKDDLDSTAEYVVGTYSYSPEEYVEMKSLQIFVTSLHNTNILSKIGEYVRATHDVQWGEFYTDIKTMLQCSPILGKDFRKITESITSWVMGEKTELFIDYREEFKYEIQPINYILFITGIMADDFFSEIGRYLSVKYNDPKINELCGYVRFTNYSLSYEINEQQTFTHNWKEWSEGQDLIEEESTYQVKDKDIRVGPKLLPIDWQEKKGTPDYLTHYFYRVCYTNLGTKDLKKVERI